MTVERTPKAEDHWKHAAQVLQQNDHYIQIMLDAAVGHRWKKWWQRLFGTYPANIQTEPAPMRRSRAAYRRGSGGALGRRNNIGKETGMTRSRRVAAGMGATMVLFYLASTLGLVREVNVLTLALAFGIGPAAIVGVRRLTASVETGGAGEWLRVGRFFLVTAFVIFTCMVVVQQTASLQFRDLIAQAPDSASAQALRVVARGVSVVQQGLDVSFDVFYCIGLVALAVALGRDPAFGRLVGLAGMVSGAGLLALNLIAFPYVPREAGLVDLGPATGLWWLLVIALQVRRLRRLPPIPQSA